MMQIARMERTLISAAFGLAGITKLMGLEFESEAFLRWGFPIGFMYFVGVLEVAGAIGMWLRRLAPFVALCLAGLAAGALGLRVVFQEWPMAAATGLLLALAVHYAWSHRGALFPGERLPHF